MFRVRLFRLLNYLTRILLGKWSYFNTRKNVHTCTHTFTHLQSRFIWTWLLYLIHFIAPRVTHTKLWWCRATRKAIRRWTGATAVNMTDIFIYQITIFRNYFEKVSFFALTSSQVWPFLPFTKRMKIYALQLHDLTLKTLNENNFLCKLKIELFTLKVLYRLSQITNKTKNLKQ